MKNSPITGVGDKSLRDRYDLLAHGERSTTEKVKRFGVNTVKTCASIAYQGAALGANIPKIKALNLPRSGVTSEQPPALPATDIR